MHLGLMLHDHERDHVAMRRQMHLGAKPVFQIHEIAGRGQLLLIRHAYALDYHIAQMDLPAGGS